MPKRISSHFDEIRKIATRGSVMTEIIEHRWKCDFCGNVSPTLDTLEIGHGFVEIVWPTGWVTVNRGELIAYNTEQLHFCTPAHQLAFEKNAEEILE